MCDYVKSLKGKLEIYFLSGYAPELNPDEFAWDHLKKQGSARNLFVTGSRFAR